MAHQLARPPPRCRTHSASVAPFSSIPGYYIDQAKVAVLIQRHGQGVLLGKRQPGEDGF